MGEVHSPKNGPLTFFVVLPRTEHSVIRRRHNSGSYPTLLDQQLPAQELKPDPVKHDENQVTAQLKFKTTAAIYQRQLQFLLQLFLFLF
jgi:hypothetical protein